MCAECLGAEVKSDLPQHFNTVCSAAKKFILQHLSDYWLFCL